MKRALPLLTTAILTLCAIAATAAASPIESTGPAPSLPAFQGHAAKARPLPAAKVTHAPQNPFMASGSNGNVMGASEMNGTGAHRILGNGWPAGADVSSQAEESDGQS